MTTPSAALHALIEALKDENPEVRVRCHAAEGLGRMEAQEGVGPLAAITALGRIRGDQPTAVLGSLLQDDDQEVHDAAVRALRLAREQGASGARHD